MKFGIPISFTLHAAFLGGGIFLFNETPYLPDERIIIPVDIVSVAEETNIKTTVKRREPDIQPQPDVSTAEIPLENTENVAPSREPAVTQPVVEPSEALVVVDEADDEVPDDETEDVSEAETQPSFDLDNLSALIDRSRDSQPIANQQKVLQSEETLYAFADVARRGAGAADGLALSQIDALRAAMYKCWRIPADAKDPESLIIPVEVKLHRDGHIASVNLKNAGAIYGSPNPYMKVAADNALRAVSKCAPYDFLPADQYDGWKQMTLTFRPILSQ